jgi:hypothetical protein
MSVIVIDKKEWYRLNQKLNSMERLMHSILKQQQEIIIPKEDGFISFEDASSKYKLSRQSLTKKAKKYKVTRLKVGKSNLLKESELIEAFKYKEPKPLFFQKQKN